MARAAATVLSGLTVSGVVVAPGPETVPGMSCLVGEHPIPGPGSLAAGARLLELAGSAGPDDLVLVLLSGGGSALAEAPRPGVAVGDLAALNAALLASGLPIAAVNTVRRRLSLIKGGGLARAAAPAAVATLVVSDVVGSPPEAIAGGPTAADPTAPGEAAAILKEAAIAVPASLREVLAALADPAPPGSPLVVIGDGPMAASAAADAARHLGLRATVAARPLLGEARIAGVGLAAATGELAAGEMAIHWGETTVRVVGQGVGGRNHELALAAGVALEGRPGGALVACLATDGVDGPSGAAGGIGDGLTVARGRRQGLDAAASLAANDSATYLTATGDRLRCGPTGTNVGDLAVAYRFA
jgi:glycerate-2-kinase